MSNENNGWIRIEDRLPPVGEDFLIFVPTLNIGDRKQFDIAWLDDGKCNDGFCFVGSTYGFDLPQVTHWRPIPHPPAIK